MDEIVLVELLPAPEPLVAVGTHVTPVLVHDDVLRENTPRVTPTVAMVTEMVARVGQGVVMRNVRHWVFETGKVPVKTVNEIRWGATVLVVAR